MKNLHFAAFVAAMVLIILSSCNSKQEVYEWRGPGRSGVYPETGLMKAWPEEGPALVWEYDDLGSGYGSPVFTPDNMYILGEHDSLAYLFAFDAGGNLLWKKAFGPEWVKNYNGSRSAPTVVGDLIYVTSGRGMVACFNTGGDMIWQKDMVNDLQGVHPLFGFSESVLVDGDRVFCTPGGPDTNVVALDRYTGDIVWVSKGAGERPGYNSPQLIRLKSRDILVNFSAYHLMGHDAETGQLLWMQEQDNIKPEDRKPGAGDTHSNTVLYHDGCIYYAEGDGNGGVKLRLSDDGTSIEQVWRNPAFDSFMGGIVKIGDHLWGCSSAKRDFRSINATSGKIEKSLKVNSGAVIAADGMLYYYNWAGDVMLIPQDPLNMQVVSKFKITKGSKEHFAHPVINNGRLYIRHGEVIQAFNIKV